MHARAPPADLAQMWSLAEADILSGSGYRLRDTGQGVHRVQSAPHVGRFMSGMLGRMQTQVAGGWVGSSAVHLGDNDVPNALVWIDKYTQIPRILTPIIEARPVHVHARSSRRALCMRMRARGHVGMCAWACGHGRLTAPPSMPGPGICMCI